RFAITYHRKLRDKRMTKSVLDDVPGLGPTRRRRLLKEFGSVKRLREQSLETLLELSWLPENVGRTLYDHLHGGGMSSLGSSCRPRAVNRHSPSPSSPACPARAAPRRPTCSRTLASSSSTTCPRRSSGRSRSWPGAATVPTATGWWSTSAPACSSRT